MSTTTSDNLSAAPTRSASPLTVPLTDLLRDALPDVHLLAPGSKAFEDERKRCWNKDVIHVPAAIVQPETTAEVCAAVKVACARGERLVIAGGRHGHDCMADGALVLDLSKMTKVTVNTAERLVTVEGGARLGDMDRACKEHGLAVVTGTNADTGVVGLSTCGGAGWLSRRYGLAIDNFVSAEVVLASGEAVVATADNEHRDLLWAISGAGSNFGVVTKLTQRAHPIDQVFGGMVINVAMTKGTAKAIVTGWRDWLLAAPRSVNSLAVLPCGAPVVPMAIAETDQEVVPQGEGVPCRLADIPSLSNVLGSRAGLSVWPFGGAFGSGVTIKQVKKMQYHSELQNILEEQQASGHYYDTAAVVPELSAEVIACLVHYTRAVPPNKLAAVILFPLNGAVGDRGPTEAAYYGAGRPANAFWIIIEAKFEVDAEGKDRASVVAWAKELQASLRQFGVGETAHNLDGNMEAAMAGVPAIFGPNEERLRRVKAIYDGGNFFKCNRNIKPAAAYEKTPA